MIALKLAQAVETALLERLANKEIEDYKLDVVDDDRKIVVHIKKNGKKSKYVIKVGYRK